jgi:hypothetical protein
MNRPGEAGALHDSIALDTYSHVLPNMQKEAVKAMEELLNRALYLFVLITGIVIKKN